MGKTSNPPDVVEKKEKFEQQTELKPTKNCSHSSYFICVNTTFFILALMSLGYTAYVSCGYNAQIFKLDARISKLEEINRIEQSVGVNRPERYRRDVSYMRPSQRHERQASVPPTSSECTCPPGKIRTISALTTLSSIILFYFISFTISSAFLLRFYCAHTYECATFEEVHTSKCNLFGNLKLHNSVL